MWFALCISIYKSSFNTKMCDDKRLDAIKVPSYFVGDKTMEWHKLMTQTINLLNLNPKEILFSI